MTGRRMATALPADSVRIAVDTFTEPFWRAAQEGRLVAAQCASCQTFRMPPTPFCPSCSSQDIHWIELPGTGTIFSFTVVDRYPGVGEIVMVPAVIDVDGAPGVRLVSPVVDVDPADVRIGMPVRVQFVPIADDWKLPVFTPASERSIT